MSSCTNLQLLLDHLGKLPTKISSKTIDLFLPFHLQSYKVMKWHQLIFVKSTGWFFPNHLQNIGACQIELSCHPRVLRWKKYSNTHLCQPVHHTSPRNPSNGDHGHYTVTWGADLFCCALRKLVTRRCGSFAWGCWGSTSKTESIKSISGKLVSVDGSEIRREKTTWDA